MEALGAKFARVFNRKDAAAVAAFYTDNATVLPPNGQMIRGKREIHEFWQDLIKLGGRNFVLKTVEVGSDCKVAYEVGTYTLTIQPSGSQAVEDRGKYVVVWGRQGDGSWKLLADIWNTSLPPPG